MGNVGKYSGKALTTMEKIMGNITSYYPNQLYKNAEYNLYWFINSKGYMHILKPCRVTLDEKFLYYAIEDNLLTTDNMLQSKCCNGKYTTIQELLEELEQKIEK